MGCQAPPYYPASRCKSAGESPEIGLRPGEGKKVRRNKHRVMQDFPFLSVKRATRLSLLLWLAVRRVQELKARSALVVLLVRKKLCDYATTRPSDVLQGQM